MIPSPMSARLVLPELAPGELPLVERLEADLVVLGRRRVRVDHLGGASVRPARCSGSSWTSVLDAGIDDAVGDVGEEVREHDEDRGDQQDAHEDRVVELAGRVDRELADARATRRSSR